MRKELTISSLAVGLLVGVVMTAANVYFGLYAGMTVSASIPASVLGLGIFRGILRKQDALLETNIVQTIASTGESLASGIIFTVPALIIVGAWTKFDFWTTTIIAICGGTLGVIFMIPLRKTLIVDNKTLIFPEGVACAQVLKAGTQESSAGFSAILTGMGLGALVKFCSAALNLIQPSVEGATKLGNRAWFMGGDISPALLAVGYIVGLDVSILVLLGGVIAWIIAIPMLGIPVELINESALDIAWTLWSSKVRYIGVGAMIVGGVWSLISLRHSLKASLQSIGRVQAEDSKEDISKKSLTIMLGIIFVMMLFLYNSMINHWGLSLFTTCLMIVASFLFVAVSSYVVGLVGSSNNPVSGMTISALLGTSAFFLIIGFRGDSAIIATLGVAGVVCCAACSAGDTSQDLKTGYLIGANPRLQQIAEIWGVVVPAFVIAPVLSLLHSTYGIGTGLKAPQAVLFASITKALFGGGSLPLNLVYIGMVLGVVILVIDHFVFGKSKFRLHLMPIAVGIYLPITLATPMIIGGLIKHFIVKKKVGYEEGNDPGILLASGLVAGEALMGVLVAILMYVNFMPSGFDVPATYKDIISLLTFGLIALVLYKKAK